MPGIRRWLAWLYHVRQWERLPVDQRPSLEIDDLRAEVRGWLGQAGTRLQFQALERMLDRLDAVRPPEKTRCA